MLYSREVCDFGFSDVLSEKVLHLNLTVKKVCCMIFGRTTYTML